jgi:uncharacterized membrane protein
VLAVLFTASTVSAQQAPSPEAQAIAQKSNQLPTWQRTLYKTITYQAMGNISDFLFYQALIGGAPLATGSFVIVNAATGFSLYYGFEYAWETVIPPAEDKEARSLLEKTVLYRALNSSKNFAVGYAYSGSAALASVYVASTFVSDTAIFVANEYLWNSLRPRDPS